METDSMGKQIIRVIPCPDCKSVLVLMPPDNENMMYFFCFKCVDYKYMDLIRKTQTMIVMDSMLNNTTNNGRGN